MNKSLILVAVAGLAVLAAALFFTSNDATAPVLPPPAMDEPEPATAVPAVAPTNRAGETKREPLRVRSSFVPASWDATIEFPDGTEVDIRMITWQPDPPPVAGWQNLLDVYDLLVEEAEAGNAAAAWALYRGLQYCEESFTDRASYQLALNLLRSERVRIYPSGEQSKQLIEPGEAMQFHEQDLLERFQQCEGVTRDHQQNRIQWAEMAAHNGSFQAMREMAHHHGYTPEGLRWHELGWQQGHVSAADAISVFLQRGASDPENGQADYFRAYAYLYLNYKVYAEAMSLSQSPATMNRIVSMENTVRNLGGYLTPQEQAAAESLAARLLAENENCCLGGWNVVGR